MKSKEKQYYGIKFPFTANNEDYLFVDLNEKVEDKIASEILHVILTPKRTRIRMPDFGTDLAKFVFEPNDDYTWQNIKTEVSESVSKYVSNASINDCQLVTGEDNNSVYLDLRYTVKKGASEENRRLAVKLK